MVEELQIEGNIDDYKNTYLSYIKCRKQHITWSQKVKYPVRFRFSSYHIINLRFLQTITIENNFHILKRRGCMFISDINLHAYTKR